MYTIMVGYRYSWYSSLLISAVASDMFDDQGIVSGEQTSEVHDK